MLITALLPKLSQLRPTTTTTTTTTTTQPSCTCDTSTVDGCSSGCSATNPPDDSSYYQKWKCTGTGYQDSGTCERVKPQCGGQQNCNSTSTCASCEECTLGWSGVAKWTCTDGDETITCTETWTWCL